MWNLHRLLNKSKINFFTLVDLNEPNNHNTLHICYHIIKRKGKNVTLKLMTSKNQIIWEPSLREVNINVFNFSKYIRGRIRRMCWIWTMSVEIAASNAMIHGFMNKVLTNQTKHVLGTRGTRISANLKWCWVCFLSDGGLNTSSFLWNLNNIIDIHLRSCENPIKKNVNIKYYNPY